MKIEPIYSHAGNNWELPSLTGLPDQSLIILFGTSSLIESPDLFRRLKDQCKNTSIIGCSTSGEISSSRIYDDSLVGAVIQFEKTRVVLTASPVQDVSQSFSSGKSLAEQLLAPDLKGVFVLSDGLGVNGSELVRGLNSILPSSVTVTGGLAGDGDRFHRTWVMTEEGPQSGFVTAVGLYGPAIQIGHGTKGGWDIFGPLRRVTKSKGSILYELDGKPALPLYKQYLGDQANGLPATGLLFPLSLRKDSTENKNLVRTILAVDEKNQSLTFAGDIPEGYFVQMMQANFDRLISGAADAATITQKNLPQGTPILAIAISCVGRRLVLGERCEEEIESTLEVFPEGTHQIGFYSYGELSPYRDGKCDLHNQTMTLTTIAEP